jgi:bifunctional DNA-binding transcriptional regulator/antitoxin component of YhaV-PrlF toxin-antitoxin module
MVKTVYKVLDSENRILIPQNMRSALGVSAGDIIGLTEERGKIIVKKAIAVDDEPMPTLAKESYVKSVVREFDEPALAELMEIIAKLLRERGKK